MLAAHCEMHKHTPTHTRHQPTAYCPAHNLKQQQSCAQSNKAAAEAATEPHATRGKLPKQHQPSHLRAVECCSRCRVQAHVACAQTQSYSSSRAASCLRSTKACRRSHHRAPMHSVESCPRSSNIVACAQRKAATAPGRRPRGRRSEAGAGVARLSRPATAPYLAASSKLSTKSGTSAGSPTAPISSRSVA